MSLSTIDRVLKKHAVSTKQLSMVPFERNSKRFKKQIYQYVQVRKCILVLEKILGSHDQHDHFYSLIAEYMIVTYACVPILQRIYEMETQQILLYVDNAGFNLKKVRRCGRNIIGQSTTVDVPGQCEGNSTMCAGIVKHGVIHNAATTAPYNIDWLLQFLDGLYTDVIWDNVCFHHLKHVRKWFKTHQ